MLDWIFYIIAALLVGWLVWTLFTPGGKGA
jgi:hypothetical protein